MTHLHTVASVTPHIGLDLPARAVSIAVGRSVIRRVVTFRDADAESSFLVAFTEILANAVDEHRRLDLGDPVRVEIVQEPVECVRVMDAGAGIALTASAPVTAVDDGEVSERGRGLALARAFVADLELESTEDGTIATLPLHGLGIIR